MEKRAKFFRYIIANVVLIAMLSVTIVLVSTMSFSDSIPTLEPVRRGKSDNSVGLAFVVDRNDNINELLEILNQKNVVATFFISGTSIIENSSHLKQIYQSGHEIGNRGFFNVDHTQLTADRIIDEIDLTHKLIYNLIGKAPDLFLPPLYSYCETTIEVAKALGYITIVPEIILDGQMTISNINNILASLEGGEFLAMSPCIATIEKLPNIINSILEKNFLIETIGELI